MKDAIISIKSIQRDGKDENVTEVVTEGKYHKTEDGCEINYDESDVTGFPGSSTVVRVFGNKRLEMMRSGAVNSELLIEVGKKNYSNYGTPYGDFMIGALAKSINCVTDENGGSISANYVMDINTMSIGDYTLDISIKLP